ncbi:MAG TPA: hypothetical protein VIF83_14030 [Gemmatimonadaceae bacterium]
MSPSRGLFLFGACIALQLACNSKTGDESQRSIDTNAVNASPTVESTAVADSGRAAPASVEPDRRRGSLEPRDSAIEPTMEVGPDGKLRPIKR